MKVLLVLVLCAALAGCGGSSTPTPSPTPVPTVTGQWTGTVTSNSGPSSSVSGGLTQGVTNPDGSILFSGTFTFTNSCISALSISGKIAGSAFALTGTFTDGTTLNVTATINSTDTQITGNYQNTAGSVCTADAGTFRLTKQ